MKVCNHIGESGDHQLARAVNATRSSDAWMLGEHSDMPDYLEHCFDGRAGVGTAEILLD
jgi:hypothetical protein